MSFLAALRAGATVEAAALASDLKPEVAERIATSPLIRAFLQAAP